jgi:hypothetical protein
LVSKSQVRVFVNDENPFTDASITQTISHCEGAQRSWQSAFDVFLCSILERLM